MKPTANLSRVDRSRLNARFHQQLTEHHCDADDKAAIVNQVSNGKFTSARDLNIDQLIQAIQLLDNRRNESIKRMRAKAINKAKELGILPDQIVTNEDWKGLNTFAMHTFKKQFYQLEYNDLRNCITGLENWQSNRQDRAIKQLLS